MSAAPSALRAAAVAPTDGVLGDDTVRGVLAEGLEGHHRGESVLVLVPDHTRTAPLPLIVATLNDVLGEAAAVHVLVALGTHPPLDDRSLADLIGLDSIDPTDRHPGLTVGNHRWRDDGELVTVGVVTRDELAVIAGPLWHPSLGGDLPLRINRAVLEHDHVIIVGPTFPHEVVGFSGGAKYFFPWAPGPEMIDASLARRPERRGRNDRTCRHPDPAAHRTSGLADPDPGDPGIHGRRRRCPPGGALRR